ncbi:Rhodanese domain protein [Halosimplex carlsbadense 2-9-1]|uniref:Rhodanese domain protein n=1 Tax=Halosimplex carlsbadense 2-9-1 TaxID=797114 RepID=M0CZ25_9EURY|nr:sulfurtransferase [Halosimplex carlsbadense]ELZ27682.1 Rhodanese domain protein [Halosimplex carlsbadense 2-9-1]
MSDIVVPAEWVADRLDEVRIVDTRDAWEFDGIGHIPGAVNVPFDSFRADEHAAEDDTESEPGGPEGDAGGATTGQGMLPGAEVFTEIMSEAGITADDRIVAYDDTHGVFAARFLVTAGLYGHDPERLHLLDGDFSAWRLDHETASEVADFDRSEYVVDPPAETPLVGIDAVAAATDDPDTVVVDTREGWEFEEGHIPGAVRLDWRELVDDETRGLRPREEIESILDERGIAPDKRVLLYCNTARRISHTYTVLRHLGYPDLAFYEGSLTEWKADGRNLETGA